MNCIKCHKELPWSIERLGKDLCYKCWEVEKRTRGWYKKEQKAKAQQAFKENGRYEDDQVIIH